MRSIAAGLVLLACEPAAAEGWGTIQGRVVFAGDKLPDNPEVKVTSDRKHCLSKGPIRRDELVVNPKNRGVRWVLVWLAPVKDFKKPKTGDLPIHPSLKKVPQKAEIKAPRCVFEPRVLGIREGTTLVFRNDTAVLHAVTIPSEVRYGALAPAPREPAFKDLKARLLPRSVSCSIHAWMKGWIGVFHHPYFAVTDADGRFEIRNAPAGKWRLLMWQEKVGWVIFRNKDDRGRIVEIKGGRTVRLDDVPLRNVPD
jgi:hypothetical protein